jgi:hypothetical protein
MTPARKRVRDPLGHGPIFVSLVKDSSGAHDVLVGGSTPASILAAYGAAALQHPENS